MESIVSYILNGLLIFVGLLLCLVLHRLYVALTRPVPVDEPGTSAEAEQTSNHVHLVGRAIVSDGWTNQARLQQWHEALRIHLDHQLLLHELDAAELEKIVALLQANEQLNMEVQHVVPIKKVVIYDDAYEKTFNEANALLNRFRLNSGGGYVEGAL